MYTIYISNTFMYSCPLFSENELTVFFFKCKTISRIESVTVMPSHAKYGSPHFSVLTSLFLQFYYKVFKFIKHRFKTVFK